MINSFKQKQIYNAMGWEVPKFAHIPLIHSEKGKKLSKRDNASTIDEYIKIGIIPEALRNYLLRLGWSYKDKEIFSLDESIKLFNFAGIGKSPSKLDMSRILSMNETYIKSINEKDLFRKLIEFSNKFKTKIDESKENMVLKSLNFLKNKAKTLEDIYNNSKYILTDNIVISDGDKSLIDKKSQDIIKNFIDDYEKLSDLKRESVEQIIKNLIDKHKTNFKGVGQPLRIGLVGSKFGPGIYDIILSLDKTIVINRLKKIDLMIKPYLFSPSEFAFGYSGCKRCYYDLKVNDIKINFGFPTIFSKIDSIQKRFYHNKPSKYLNTNKIPDGIIKTDYTKLHKSEVFYDYKDRAFQLKGKIDAYVQHKNFYSIIDFKVTNLNEKKSLTYMTQLNSYALMFEKPEQNF